MVHIWVLSSSWLMKVLVHESWCAEAHISVWCTPRMELLGHWVCVPTVKYTHTWYRQSLLFANQVNIVLICTLVLSNEAEHFFKY